MTAGLAIYDTMQYLASPVQTICMGQAASMAAVLLCGGSKGKRFILPSARVMIHQPWGNVEGQETDIRIQAKELERIKELTIEILMRHTGKSREAIITDTDRDFFLTASEAVAYGIVDNVMQRRA